MGRRHIISQNFILINPFYPIMQITHEITKLNILPIFFNIFVKSKYRYICIYQYLKPWFKPKPRSVPLYQESFKLRMFNIH